MVTGTRRRRPMRRSPAVRCALMLAMLATPLIVACGGGPAPQATPAAPQTPSSAAATSAPATASTAAPAAEQPTAPAAATQAVPAAATQPAAAEPTAAASGQGGGTFVIAS